VEVRVGWPGISTKLELAAARRLAQMDSFLDSKQEKNKKAAAAATRTMEIALTYYMHQSGASSSRRHLRGFVWVAAGCCAPSLQVAYKS
jgi:hypothetical protein